MRANKKILICCMLALSLLNGCGAKKQDTQASTPEKPKTTENKVANQKILFTTEDTEKNKVDSSIFFDSKYTVFNIWGTFCPACQEEISDLAQIYDSYKDKGVNVVGVLVDAKDDDGNVKEDIIKDYKDLMKNAKANYKNILLNDEITKLYLNDVKYIPYTIILDSDANIVKKIDNIITKDELTKILDELLK